MSELPKRTGLPEEKRNDAARIVEDLSTELMFTPGRQPEKIIQVEELHLLLQAARDGLIARTMYDALVPAEEQLIRIGTYQSAFQAHKSRTTYEELHPEINSAGEL